MNKIYLFKKLFNLNINETYNIVKFLNNFNNLTSQLESVGITLDEKLQALLLSSLPDN